MGFNNLFAIGLSGVNAFSQSLESVSNNIANTQTNGFKRTRTDFSDLVTRANANQGPSGVSSSIQSLIGEQGSITRTSSATDLAISGNGFFVVSAETGGSAPFLFTRAGGFSIQDDGRLSNESGQFLRAAPIASANAASLNALEIVNVTQSPQFGTATTQISLSGNLSNQAAIGDVLRQNLTVTDEAGNSRNIEFLFTNTAPNNWTASARFTDGANEVLATGSLIFDGNGRIDPASPFPANGIVTTPTGDQITLSFGNLISSVASSSITEARADGAASAPQTGVEIDDEGVIFATYANGERQALYQIVLATFTNENALDVGEFSTFIQNNDAGALSLDRPRSGRAGVIEAQALEISTVDIGQEFSTLIETQRAYAANTRILSLADELWQTLTETAR